jgi:hypothetical protein
MIAIEREKRIGVLPRMSAASVLDALFEREAIARVRDGQTSV